MPPPIHQNHHYAGKPCIHISRREANRNNDNIPSQPRTTVSPTLRLRRDPASHSARHSHASLHPSLSSTRERPRPAAKCRKRTAILRTAGNWPLARAGPLSAPGSVLRADGVVAAVYLDILRRRWGWGEGTGAAALSSGVLGGDGWERRGRTGRLG